MVQKKTNFWFSRFPENKPSADLIKLYNSGFELQIDDDENQLGKQIE